MLIKSTEGLKNDGSPSFVLASHYIFEHPLRFFSQNLEISLDKLAKKMKISRTGLFNILSGRSPLHLESCLALFRLSGIKDFEGLEFLKNGYISKGKLPISSRFSFEFEVGNSLCRLGVCLLKNYLNDSYPRRKFLSLGELPEFLCNLDQSGDFNFYLGCLEELALCGKTVFNNILGHCVKSFYAYDPVLFQPEGVERARFNQFITHIERLDPCHEYMVNENTFGNCIELVICLRSGLEALSRSYRRGLCIHFRVLKELLASAGMAPVVEDCFECGVKWIIPYQSMISQSTYLATL